MPSLVYPRERVYRALCAAVSAAAYIGIAILSRRNPSLLSYVVGIALFLLISHAVLIGRIRGNAVRVSPEQFPELARIAIRLAEQMGFSRLPAIYVLQAGGLLNAFATRFFGRNFIVIYSDVLELAYSEGEHALEFVVAHEFGHLVRRHPTLRALLFPAMLVPFLGSAYSRACEYTSDRFGLRYAPTHPLSGLLVLAAGKQLYRRMNAERFAAQAASESGFLTWLAEIFESHPLLSKRVRALDLGSRRAA